MLSLTESVTELPSSNGNERLRLLPWVMLAFTAPFFALVSWLSWDVNAVFQWRISRDEIPVVFIEVLFVAWAIFTGRSFIRVLVGWPNWSKWTLALLTLVSLLTAATVAENPVAAFTRTWQWLVHLAFGLSVYSAARRDWPWLRKCFWPTVCAGFATFAAILIAYVGSLRGDEAFDWRYLGLAVANVRQLGFYSVVGAGAAIALASGQASAKWRMFAFVAGALALAISFWSGTRSSIVAIWIACIAASIWFAEVRKSQFWVLFVTMNFAGLWLATFYPIPNLHYGIERIVRSVDSKSLSGLLSGRLDMWAATLRAIMERPILGHGLDQFGPAFELNGIHFGHPHNIFLQALYSWGIVGALCFFALAAFVLRLCYGVLLSGRASNLGAFVVGAGLLIISLYEGSLVYPYPIMMVATSVALLCASEPTGLSASLVRRSTSPQ